MPALDSIYRYIITGIIILRVGIYICTDRYVLLCYTLTCHMESVSFPGAVRNVDQVLANYFASRRRMSEIHVVDR